MTWRNLAGVGWGAGMLVVLATSCGRTREGTTQGQLAGAGGQEDEPQQPAGDASGGGGASGASGASGDTSEPGNFAGHPAAGQGGGDGGESGSSFVDTAALHVAAHCERVERCELDPELQQVPGGCVAALLPSWRADLREAEQRIAAGTLIYDPTALEACLEGRRSAACDDPNGDFPEACRLVFDGPLAVGEPCSASIECEGTAQCRGCPGRCVALSEIGAACDDEHLCVFEARCRSGLCVAMPTQGEACNVQVTPVLPCAGSLSCVGATPLQDGECSPFSHAARGASCNPDEGMLCEPDSVCVNTELVDGTPQATCQEREHAASECWSGYEDSCPVGQYCPLTLSENYQGVLSAACLELGKAGEHCYSPRGCVPTAICSHDICVEQKDLGEPCLQSDECWSGTCEQGTCAFYDACLNAAAGPLLLRNSAPLEEACPTHAPGGLVAGFDEAGVLSRWDSSPVAASFSWAEDGASCAGSLHLNAQMSPTSSFASVSSKRALASWTGRQRLHVWAKLSAPGVDAQEGLLGVQAWASTDAGGYYSRSVDASWMRDGEWHELVVIMDRNAVARPGAWGIDLWTPDAAALEPPFDVDLFIDDVWVE